MNLRLTSDTNDSWAGSAAARAGGALQARWQQLAVREQRALQLTAWVLGLALLWWVGLAPALRTLRQVEQRVPVLQAQAQQMRAMQAQARALQALPRLAPDEARRALEASLKQNLGSSALLSWQGERASVTLKAAPAEALALWLVQARSNARAVPVQVRLQRQAGATWDGTITLSLAAAP